jgi:5-methylcytosine-specific restriction endonuclease McrA
MVSHPPIAPRKPLNPEPRRRLSRVEFAQLMLEQEGRCAGCGEKLKADQIIDEHLNPLYSGGSNELENRALFCLGCAREKTIDDTAVWGSTAAVSAARSARSVDANSGELGPGPSRRRSRPTAMAAGRRR